MIFASFLPSYRALEVLGRPEVREVLSVPCPVPPQEREVLAAILAADLLGEAPTVVPEDIPGMVLVSLFRSRAWSDARDLTEERSELVPETLRRVLPKVLEAVEKGLVGLDWGEVPDEERRETEELLERLLDPRAERGAEETLSPEQRQALSLVLRLLVRGLDRNIAALIERLRQDAEVITRLENILPGQGWDLHRVGLHRTALGNLERYATVLRNHRDVEHLMELLGRTDGEMDRRSMSQSHSCSETHSLRFSGDLQRMLPQEMVNLADERLKLLFYARLCERRLLTYQLRGRNFMDGEKKRGGPVVALLDSSGSMRGEPELAAKALLLALARRLIEDRRSLRALMFSMEVHGYDLAGKGSAPQFLDFLCHSFGGGTDFDTALRKGIECLEDPAWHGADILFITDGLARIRDRGCLHDWNCLKERQGARIFTVIVGGTEPGGLKRISDQVFLMGLQCEWRGGSLLREFTPQPRSLGSCWVTQ